MAQSARSKFAQYRARKREAGKRLLRIWVLDIRSPDAHAALATEMAILREAPEQADAIAFLEAVEREDRWPG